MTALADPSLLILEPRTTTLPINRAAERPITVRLAWLGTAVVALTLFVFIWRWNAPGLDDAWITYRYARNIAAGHGWVYNAGERLQGGSTPLYTLWLAACGACGLPIPAASAVTCCLATCGTMLLIFLFLAQRQNAVVGLLAVTLVLFSPFLRTVTGGMETAVYVFFCISALFCAGSGRWRLSFILAGLAMFTRLDGAAILAVVTFWHIVSRRRIPFKEMIFPVALNLAWFAFAWWYFGKPLPNSFHAKRFHTGHAQFSWWMILAILRLPPAYVALALTGVGCAARRRGGALMPLVFWAAGYVAAYSLSQLEFYAWYVAPMVLVVCVLAAVGVGGLAELMPTSWRWGKLAIASLAAVSLLPALADARRIEDTTLERARYDGAQYARAHVPSGAIIQAAGIGEIGWWTGNPLLDAAGLVTPRTLANRPAPWFWHALADVAERERPQFIFDSAETRLGWPAAITRDYHPVAAFPHENPQFTPFVLWERNPAMPSPFLNSAMPQ